MPVAQDLGAGATADGVPPLGDSDARSIRQHRCVLRLQRHRLEHRVCLVAHREHRQQHQRGRPLRGRSRIKCPRDSSYVARRSSQACGTALRVAGWHAARNGGLRLLQHGCGAAGRTVAGEHRRWVEDSRRGQRLRRGSCASMDPDDDTATCDATTGLCGAGIRFAWTCDTLGAPCEGLQLRRAAPVYG